MSWDYADHSHEVKEHGGVEQYTQDIHDGGVAEGRVQGGGVVGAVALVLGVAVELGRRIYNSKTAKAATAKQIIEAELKSSAPIESASEEVLPDSQENASDADNTQDESRNLVDSQNDNPKNTNVEEE